MWRGSHALVLARMGLFGSCFGLRNAQTSSAQTSNAAQAPLVQVIATRSPSVISTAYYDERRNMNSYQASSRKDPRTPFEQIVLVLQGGGALGSYQAGVYQALAEADLHPNWVAGISIGAINSAIIAGNAPDKRV